jgi:hypothetical protein
MQYSVAEKFKSYTVQNDHVFHKTPTSVVAIRCGAV